MRAPSLLALAALALGGCAKSPSNGGATDYTRLHFRFTLDPTSTANPRYIYVVAIRPLYLPNNPPSDVDEIPGDTTTDDGFGPTPVYTVTTGNPKNGFVEGRPTRYVQYDPVAGPYQLYRFQKATTPNDDNPVDLSSGTFVRTINLGYDPTSPGNDPYRFEFDVYTDDLVIDKDNAQKIYAIQFNIIATNKPLQSAGDANGRVVDSLGDQTQLATTGKGYGRAVIVSSGNYSNVTTELKEPAGDLLPAGSVSPDVDLTSWSLDVATP